MDLDDVKNRVSRKEAELVTHEKRLEQARSEEEEATRIYSDGLRKDDGRERSLPSLATQEQKLISCNAKVKALETGKEHLESELKDLKTEARHCDLYETQGKRYLRAMSNCEEAHSQIMSLLKSLKRDLAVFNSSVSDLVKEQGTARAAFSILYADIDSGLSLREFLDGKITEVEESDKKVVAEEIRSKVMAISDIRHEDISREFQEFQQVMEMLSQWRKFYLSKRGNQPQYAFVYKPKGVRIIAPDGTTARAHRELERSRTEEEKRKSELKKRRQFQPAFGAVG